METDNKERKMGFCGSKSDAMRVEDGVLQNECFVDVLNIIPHATISLIGIFIVTVWNHSVMGKLKAKTWVHFQVCVLKYKYYFFVLLVVFWEKSNFSLTYNVHKVLFLRWFFFRSVTNQSYP